MVLLDLLGRRWTLRICSELLAGDGLGFSELQVRCAGVSPSVLSQRLRELADARVVELDGGRYRLTRLARELSGPLQALDAWATRWARARR
jgi:DNA-binding HxlR family transcriptional regulator